MTTLTSDESSSVASRNDDEATKVKQRAMLDGLVLPTLLKLALPTVVVLVVHVTIWATTIAWLRVAKVALVSAPRLPQCRWRHRSDTRAPDVLEKCRKRGFLRHFPLRGM